MSLLLVGQAFSKISRILPSIKPPARQVATKRPPPMNSSRQLNLQEMARNTMSPQQYNICFKEGTEPPFTGQYWNHHEQGIYRCAACKNNLFASKDKFNSGTGWPSFTRVIGEVEQREDQSHGMIRTEVRCANCGCHLGHVFPDGPLPTKTRFCINSASLDFQSQESQNPDGH